MADWLPMFGWVVGISFVLAVIVTGIRFLCAVIKRKLEHSHLDALKDS